MTDERHARVRRLSAGASLQRRTTVIISVRREAETGEHVAGWRTCGWISGLVVRIRNQGCGRGGGLWHQVHWEDGKWRSESRVLKQRLPGMACNMTAEWVAEERGEKDCCAAGQQRTGKPRRWIGYTCGCCSSEDYCAGGPCMGLQPGAKSAARQGGD